MDYDLQTALIVVDVQNDFADPKGNLYVKGGEAVVPVANREIQLARRAGSTIAYTQDWHPPVTPHFKKDGGIWPTHCVMNTWGAEFHPDLDVDGVVTRKGSGGEDGYSGFTVRDPRSGVERATELEGKLRHAGVHRLVILGLATDYCVRETALDALRLGFDATVPVAGVRAVDLQFGDGARALEAIRHAGGVLSDQ